MREVDIMQRLRHPNIIRLVEALDTPEQVSAFTEASYRSLKSLFPEFSMVSYHSISLKKVRQFLMIHMPHRAAEPLRMSQLIGHFILSFFPAVFISVYHLLVYEVCSSRKIWSHSPLLFVLCFSFSVFRSLN